MIRSYRSFQSGLFSSINANFHARQDVDAKLFGHRKPHWIPAFAGMTDGERLHICRNVEASVVVGPKANSLGHPLVELFQDPVDFFCGTGLLQPGFEQRVFEQSGDPS